MNTFMKFFTGTTGIIFAIILCGLCVLAVCVISSGVLISIVPTPTP